MASLMLQLTENGVDLGSLIVVTYGVVFVMTPVLTAVLMRFSLLKCYVDPIAAAEIPLFLYSAILFNQSKRTGDLSSAFLLVNNRLGGDGGKGWLFLVGLFVFGLLMSFSFARKNEQSISYRLIAKISNKSTIQSINSNSEQRDNIDDYHIAD